MNFVFRQLARYDWLLMGAVLLLMVIGLVSLFSLSSVGSVPYFRRQLVWVAVGLLLLFGASSVDFRIFRTQSAAVFSFYIVAVTLLAVVLLIGLRVRGIEGWLRFGNLFLQPVEPTKLAVIILLAKFFSKRHIEIYRIRHLVVSGIYVAIPTLLVLVQPDLGSAIILVSIWIAMIVFSGMRLRHFFLLSFIALLVMGVGWRMVLEPYQKARITAFINPYADPKGGGYQMIQAMIAVGSGQMWGKGIGYGSQSHLNFLPEAETDFIFAAFAEEWGFIGTLTLILLFILMLWRIIYIGQKSADNFSRLYTLGFAAFIFVQSFIHIAMNMGLMPITGITLPFVSYGGSSLVTLLVGIGILQSIKVNARRDIELYGKEYTT